MRQELLYLFVFIWMVAAQVQNEGKECWSRCGSNNGRCSYCGTAGLCCRYGYTGGGCDGKMGLTEPDGNGGWNTGGGGDHRCTAPVTGKSVKYRGHHCTVKDMNCPEGPCDYCGPQGMCCRVKDTGNGCDGKIGGDGHHMCTPKFGDYGRNWMGRIDGDKYLNEITIPGTHNTCAGGSCSPVAKCQDKTLADQTLMGVRFFDLRFVHRDNSFNIYHGPCNTGYSFENVLQHLKDFLEDNPSETFIVSYSHYTDKEENVSQTFQDTLTRYLNDYAEIVYQGTVVPQLKYVRGRIVFLNFGGHGDCSGGRQGLCKSHGAWSDSTVENNYAPLTCGNSYINSLKDNMRQAETPGIYLYITYISASDWTKAYVPKEYSNCVNPKIHNHLLLQEGTKPAGIVVWDFIRDYNVMLHYSKNW